MAINPTNTDSVRVYYGIPNPLHDNDGSGGGDDDVRVYYGIPNPLYDDGGNAFSTSDDYFGQSLYAVETPGDFGA